MEKKDRNEWTKKFRELGKKKGSHKDFAKLYKEMKTSKEKNKKSRLNLLFIIWNDEDLT